MRAALLSKGNCTNLVIDSLNQDCKVLRLLAAQQLKALTSYPLRRILSLRASSLATSSRDSVLKWCSKSNGTPFSSWVGSRRKKKTRSLLEAGLEPSRPIGRKEFEHLVCATRFKIKENKQIVHARANWNLVQSHQNLFLDSSQLNT